MLREDFIKKAKEVHGEEYEYLDLPKEFSVRDKIHIKCKKHGVFLQVVFKHLYGQKCKKCSDIEKGRKRALIAFDKFKKEANSKFGDKYDYSKAVYVDNRTPIEIICPIHGSFWQNPTAHLKSPSGCPSCTNKMSSIRQSMGLDEFINRATLIHGNKYDYSKVKYVNNRTKVCIICKNHGEFWQTPDSHLSGQGCKKCYYERLSKIKHLTNDEFIRKAKEVHNNRYDYSKVEYRDSHTKVCIICPIHGEFLQLPSNHLSGNGCPKCNSSTKSKLEREVRNALANEDFDEQKYFPFLKNGRGILKLDFYLPKYNAGIECQGIQHFTPINHFDGDIGFEKNVRRDIRKKQLCENNGIRIYYFSHEDFDRFLGENVYHNIDELLEEIKKV